MTFTYLIVNIKLIPDAYIKYKYKEFTYLIVNIKPVYLIQCLVLANRFTYLIVNIKLRLVALNLPTTQTLHTS